MGMERGWTTLVTDGINKLRETGIPFIVVLGHPEYYPRFGFERGSKYGVRCQWKVPDEAFMVKPLGGHLTPGLAKYRAEFLTLT